MASIVRFYCSSTGPVVGLNSEVLLYRPYMVVVNKHHTMIFSTGASVYYICRCVVLKWYSRVGGCSLHCVYVTVKLAGSCFVCRCGILHGI